jgi:hypothetical protein
MAACEYDAAADAVCQGMALSGRGAGDGTGVRAPGGQGEGR